MLMSGRSRVKVQGVFLLSEVRRKRERKESSSFADRDGERIVMEGD